MIYLYYDLEAELPYNKQKEGIGWDNSLDSEGKKREPFEYEYAIFLGEFPGELKDYDVKNGTVVHKKTRKVVVTKHELIAAKIAFELKR